MNFLAGFNRLFTGCGGLLSQHLIMTQVYTGDSIDTGKCKWLLVSLVSKILQLCLSL